ncbi:MAG: hypothetical protein ACOYKA_01270, partial [Legionellaceae bacterium]
MHENYEFKTQQDLIEAHTILLEHLDEETPQAQELISSALTTIKEALKSDERDIRQLIQETVGYVGTPLNNSILSKFPSEMSDINHFILQTTAPRTYDTVTPWLADKLTSSSHTEEQKSARIINEFIISEQNTLKSILPVRMLLNDYLHHPELTPNDKKIIETYLRKVDLLVKAYEELHLFDLLNPPTQSLEETLVRLCSHYQGEAYQTYQWRLEQLSTLSEVIRYTLHERYSPQDNIGSHVSPTFQRPMRYGLLWRDIQKSNPPASGETMLSIEKALTTAKNRTASLQAVVDIKKTGLYEHLPSSNERRGAAYQALLTYDDLTFPETYSQEQQSAHISRYFELLIPEASPEHAEEIFQSFENPNLSLQDSIVFRASSDPIFLILRTQTPIQSGFSLVQKIQTYQEIIKLILDGKINLDNRKPVKQARLIGETVLNVIRHEYEKDPSAVTSELIPLLNNIERSFRSAPYKRVMKSIFTSPPPDDQDNP